MLWIFLALAGYFFWSLVNVGDKYIVTNRMQSPLVYMVWLAFFNVGLLAVIPFIHFFVPSMWLLALLAFAGAIYFFGGLLYAGALALEDITRLNVWWGLIPVFVFTFAWLALGETLSGWQLVAFILLVCGVVVASLHVRGRVVRISRALWFMIASCLLFAGYAVLLRFVTQEVPFVVAFVWASLFATAVAPLVFLSTTFRRQFQSSANTLAGGVWRGVLVVTVLDNMGMFFNVWAYSLGQAALVSALGGFQAFFVFALAIPLSFKNPHLLREELDARNVMLKIIALFLMVIGIAVINLAGIW